MGFLEGLGQMGVGFAPAFGQAAHQRMAREEADRKRAEWEELQQRKGAIKEAGRDTVTQDRRGLQVTGPDGQQFYIPQAAADAGAYQSPENVAQGYKVGLAPGNYHENIVGQGQTTGQYAVPAEGPSQGLQAAANYNAPTSRFDRQAQVAADYGDPTQAAAYTSLAEAPNRRKAAELSLDHVKQQIATGQINLEQLHGEVAARPEIAALQTKLAGMKYTDPGRKETMQQLIATAAKAFTPEKAGAIVLQTTQLSAADRAARNAATSDAIHDAIIGGKQKVIELYTKDEHLPDGWGMKEVKGKGGAFKLVAYNKENPKETRDVGSFTDEKDMQRQLMMKSPELFQLASKLQSDYDQKQTWAEVTKAVAATRQGERLYQTTKWDAVATLPSGEVVWAEQGQPGLYKRVDGKTVELTDAESKSASLTAKKSGERPVDVPKITKAQIEAEAEERRILRRDPRFQKMGAVEQDATVQRAVRMKRPDLYEEAQPKVSTDTTTSLSAVPFTR